MRSANIIKRGDNICLLVEGIWYSYNIHDQPLGAGAMGTVYLGRDINNHHRVVAIKLVNPEFSCIPSVRARARLEGSLAFSHPNLIEMLGCCEDGHTDGPMFIVSKFVKGVTIDKYVSTQLVTAKDKVRHICELLYPVMDALAYLHSKSIVHLDVKPSNIMVENGCNVRLMDLGISHTGEVMQKMNAGLLGTAGYAAPEQYITSSSNGINVTPATDIYALGATLYELLSGCKRNSVVSEDCADIPGVQTSVMNVIRKAVKKDPNARFQSTQEMKKQLEEALKKKESSNLSTITYVIWGAIVFLLTLLLILFVTL